VQPELVYDAALPALGRYATRFRPLRADAATQAWLRELGARPHGWLTTFWVEQLTRFVSVYDAHGMTGSYAMHLLSSEQWRELIGNLTGRLLDVGAGAGYVTAQAAPLFQEVVCTETSSALAKRLAKRGFRVHPQDLSRVPLAGEPPFDVIACLNVLDRTPRPRSLLTHLRGLLAPGGRLVVAMPLPVRAHVHVAGATISADEPLPATEQSFEGALVELSELLFEAHGFAIERIARVPYLSRGDARSPLYVLDDAVWVLRVE
jgi:SAM-dependent methyltransferase